jgi:hypothetical protein
MLVHVKRQIMPRSGQYLKLILAIIFSFCSVLSAFSQTEQPPLSAQQLLNNVINRLPQEPMLLTGELIVRKRRGIPVKDLKFEMMLKWGDTPASARYTIKDKDNADLEQLTITRDSQNKTKLTYKAGNPLTEKTTPDLSTAVQESNVSWMDLTLSFLWWKDGKIIGSEEKFGFPCYIVKVTRPKKESDKESDKESEDQYASVKLWIDTKNFVFLQAEGYDTDNQIVRKIEMKSCKKINDRWMIKDMEIKSRNSIHQTKLRVKDMIIDPEKKQDCDNL